jgi:hypothetical protein
MHKLALAMALAAAVAVPSSWVSSSALADSRHHQWGDRDWEIIRWSNGDCKIWHDDDGPPLGTDWVVLRDNLPTWDVAWAKLGQLRQRRKCT